MKKRFKISYNSPVILSFVLLCFFATLLGILTHDKSTVVFFSVYRCPLKDPLSYIRIFTHIFGHSGMDHFIGNVMYILILGPMLEEKYGSRVLIKVIVITAFVTGVTHVLLWDNCSLCGASGVVFVCILLSSITAFKEKEIPLSFILVAILFVGKEIYSGVFVSDNISNITHIIGGVIGSLFGFVFNKKASHSW